MYRFCMLGLTAAALFSGGCFAMSVSSRNQTQSCPNEAQHAKTCVPKQVLRHVVLFKFKDDTPADKVREIESAFAALPSKIDAIYGFEWGTDVSVEEKAQGFTHCFVVTFKSEADRARYLPHPEHKKFGSVLHPHLDKVLVVDYWTKP